MALFAAGSNFSTLLLLSASAIGSGALAMPYGVQLVGFWFGAFLLFLGACLSCTTLVIVMTVVRKYGARSYPEVMGGIFGSEVHNFLDGVVIFTSCGAVFSYFIFLGGFLSKLLQAAGAPEGSFLVNHTACMFFAYVAVLPFALARELNFFRYVSSCSLLTLFLLAAVVLVRLPGRIEEETSEVVGAALGTFGVDLSTFKVLAIFIFGYQCHVNAAVVAAEMHEPKPRDIFIVAGGSTFLTMFFYSIIALGGFVSWVGVCKENFILNYHVHDPAMIVVRFLLTCTMLFAIPINLFPGVLSVIRLKNAKSASAGVLENLEETLVAAVEKKQEPGAAEWGVIAVFILTAALIGAILFPMVAEVIGIVSSLGGTPVTILLPGLAFNRVYRAERPGLANALLAFTLGISTVMIVGTFVQAAQDAGYLPQ